MHQVDIFGNVVYDRYSAGVGIIDMSALTNNYEIGSTGAKDDESVSHMILIPETSGVIVVQLESQEEGDSYTITAAQVTAYLGKPLPYNVHKVIKTGTTATFSVVW